MMSRSILIAIEGIVRNYVKLLHFSVLSNAKTHIFFLSAKFLLFYFHKEGLGESNKIPPFAVNTKKRNSVLLIAQEIKRFSSSRARTR